VTIVLEIKLEHDTVMYGKQPELSIIRLYVPVIFEMMLVDSFQPDDEVS
jgi:hypothetical protein